MEMDFQWDWKWKLQATMKCDELSLQMQRLQESTSVDRGKNI